MDTTEWLEEWRGIWGITQEAEAWQLEVDVKDIDLWGFSSWPQYISRLDGWLINWVVTRLVVLIEMWCNIFYQLLDFFTE